MLSQMFVLVLLTILQGTEEAPRGGGLRTRHMRHKRPACHDRAYNCDRLKRWCTYRFGLRELWCRKSCGTCGVTTEAPTTTSLPTTTPIPTTTSLPTTIPLPTIQTIGNDINDINDMYPADNFGNDGNSVQNQMFGHKDSHQGNDISNAINSANKQVYEERNSIASGGWTSWSAGDYPECSHSCGGGWLVETRWCIVEPCIGAMRRNIPCNAHACRDQFGNDVGFVNQLQANQQPGMETNEVGNSIQEKESEGWTDWDRGLNECSRSCGGGTVIEQRHCINNDYRTGGKPCIGPYARLTHCNQRSC